MSKTSSIWTKQSWHSHRSRSITWEGFIFINVDPTPAEGLREYLAEIGAGLRGYPFSEISASPFCWTTELKANWKVIKDAFQEAYHVSVLHHRTIGNIF